MSALDRESEKVLNFFYQNITSPTGIGVNQIRDHFELSNERIASIIEVLRIEDFITDTPDLPGVTIRINPPNNFTPGQLYKITKRGIEYLKRQGEFKQSESHTSSYQIINKSPNAQISGNNSPGSQQNIKGNNSKNKKDESIIQKCSSMISQLIIWIKALFGH
jgi:hypothetical protein